MSKFKHWLGRTLFPGSESEPARGPSADFLNPYEPFSAAVAAEIDAETARLAGERFRREYTPLYGESVAATGTDPHNSQAGVQAWKGAVR